MAQPLGRNLGPGSNYKLNLPKVGKSPRKSSSLPHVYKPTLVAGSFHNAPKQGAGSSSASSSIFGSSQLGLSGSMNPFLGISFPKPLTATQQAAKNYNDAHAGDHNSGGIMSIIHGGEGILGKALDIISRPANAMAVMGSAELKANHNDFWSFNPSAIPAMAHGFMQGLEGNKRRNFAQDLQQGHILNGHSWIRSGLGLGMDIAGDPLNLVGGAGVYAKAGETGFGVFKGLQAFDKAGMERHIAQLADLGGPIDGVSVGRRWLEHTAMIESKGLKDVPGLSTDKLAEMTADAHTNAAYAAIAKAAAKANTNKYLGLKLGIGRASLTLRTPIKIGKTLAEKEAGLAAGKIGMRVKASIAHAVSPSYLNPVGHAAEMWQRHTAEDLTRQTWDLAKNAMKPFLKGEKALTTKEMQKALVAAADTKGTVDTKTGQLVDSVLTKALGEQGFSGTKMEIAKQFVDAYHQIGRHLRVVDRLHHVDYAKGAIEDHVYVPRVFEHGNSAEKLLYSKSALSKAGYAEKGQKIPYGVHLALAAQDKTGRKLITDPIELLGHRVQKGAIQASHGVLRQMIRDSFARPMELYDQSRRAKAYKTVDRIKAGIHQAETHIAGHEGRMFRSRMAAAQTRSTFRRSLEHAVGENAKKIDTIEKALGAKAPTAAKMAEHVVSEAKKASEELKKALGIDNAHVKIQWIRRGRHLDTGARMEREGNTITLFMHKPRTVNDYHDALHELEHAVLQHTSTFDARNDWRYAAEHSPDLTGNEHTLEEEALAWHGAIGKSIAPMTSDAAKHIRTSLGSYHELMPEARTSPTYDAVQALTKVPNRASLTRSLNAANKEKSALQRIVDEAPHEKAYTQAVTDAGVKHAKSLADAQKNLDTLGKALLTEEPKAAKRMWAKNPHALEDGWKEVEALSHPGTKASGKLHYTVPPELHASFANIEKAMVDPTRMRGIEASFTKAMSIWKLSVTSVNPGYRIRNSLSDLWNMYISGVPIQSIPLYAAKAMRTARLARNGEHKLQEGGIALTTAEKEAMNLIRTAHSQGVMSGLFEGDIGKGVDRLRKGSKNPITGYGRKATTFNAEAENIGRLTHYLWRLDHGHSSQSAAEFVRAAHFDYEDLSPFEQRVMKNIAPFYTWTRKNVPYQIQALATHPARVATYGKVATTSEQMSGAKPSDIIGHALDYHPMAIRFGGGYIDPQIGLNDLYNAENIFHGGELGMVNPALQDAYTLATGRQFQNGQALTGPEATHQAIPAPGLLAGLLQPFGLGETTQRPVNGVAKYGPGVNPWVGQIAGQIPLGSYFMSRNPIDEARKGSTPFGVDPRTLSYLGGLSYTNVDKQNQLAIAAMETAAADKAYIKHLRDQGLMAPSSWAPGNSWFDNYLKKYNKHKTQAG